MNIEVKGILKKLTITDDIVKVGRKEINNDEVTMIKYQMATVWIQGFITFCTEKGGQNVKCLNDATLNRNSLTFYKGQNEKIEEILSFFSEKTKLVEVSQIEQQPKKKVESKKRNVDDVLRCPKCGSTQFTANKKGFGIGKAVIGASLTLGVGALAGGIGRNKIVITCLMCGHQWKAGKK